MRPAAVDRPGHQGPHGVDRLRPVQPGPPKALAIGPGWLVLPFVDAPALGAAEPVPEPLRRTLAAVHAHWLAETGRAASSGGRGVVGGAV